MLTYNKLLNPAILGLYLRLNVMELMHSEKMD